MRKEALVPLVSSLGAVAWLAIFPVRIGAGP
jgi:hypothetical protein